MVLNQAAARLGQSLRETEDELMRTMLEATASFINCVGGANGDNPTEITAADVDTVTAALQNANADFVADYIEGRVFALVKFSLIDSELLDRDNEAQAKAA